MNKFISFTFLAFLCTTVCIFADQAVKGKIQWQTNYENAIRQGKTSSKPVVLFFTGSDWCSWCNKLEEEALDTSEFASAAGDRFVFVKLDFPLYTTQDPQLKAQNKQLQQKFDVRSYPTLIIFDPQTNQQIGNTGYRPGGGKQYADHLLKMVNDFSSYKQKMSALDQGKYTGRDLKELFEKAKQLDLSSDANKIVKAGMDSDESLFFSIERYRFLADEGQIHSKEAATLRTQILARDPSNEKLTHYLVALIEFEAFTVEMEKENYAPEIAIAPLVNYMDKFGATDKDNLWRLQMIVSQVYLEKNQMPRALKYAQASYEAAPANVRPEIGRAVQNIRSQIHSSVNKNHS